MFYFLCYFSRHILSSFLFPYIKTCIQWLKTLWHLYVQYLPNNQQVLLSRMKSLIRHCHICYPNAPATSAPSASATTHSPLHSLQPQCTLVLHPCTSLPPLAAQQLRPYVFPCGILSYNLLS